MTVPGKIFRFVKEIWLILGIALIMFVAIEAGVTFAFKVRELWHTPDPNFRMNADTYTDRLWAAKYFREIDEVEQGGTLRWHSYVYWRRKPRHGEYININADGLRDTVNVASPEERTSKTKVFMFGGSTMWGLGTSDENTIPSIFAREARNKGINCEVTNFGQYAFVSTQGVIELALQLQKGNIPDTVVFYDGVNDTFGSYELGVPGLPHGETVREKEFGLSARKELITVAAQSAINSLSIVRLLSGALKKTGLKSDNIQLIPLEYEKPISDKKVLAQKVVETYFNNIKMVHALSRTYGFKCLFYWQPVIYLKQNLTEYERRSLELDVNYPGLKEYYLDTYALLKKRAEELDSSLPFYDISSIFSDVREPIFVDFNHMGDRGNSAIARRMVEDYMRTVKVSIESGKHTGAL